MLLIKPQILTVLDGEAGLRLDRYFKKKFPDLPRSLLEKWCRKGNVRLNGSRVKTNALLSGGDQVRVPPLPTFSEEKKSVPKTPSLTNQDKALVESMVLYEDAHIIVLNKPPGLAVQGGTGTHRHVDALLDFFTKTNGTKPHLVHRLDRDTSGVLVVARTVQEAQWLMKAFKAKAIRKTYWALLVGTPDPQDGTIDLPLEKSKTGDREKMTVSQGGKKALTHLKVLDFASDVVSFVELIPETGRTHQLRVHCQAIGHPILGDKKYGAQEAQPFNETVKMHLHARSIEVPYPNGSLKCFEAPLPNHMQTSFERFGFILPSSRKKKV